MDRLDRLNLKVGKKFLVKIGDIGGGIHFLKPFNNRSLDYELQLFNFDKMHILNFDTVLTYLGDNVFQELFTKKYVRLTESYYINNHSEFCDEIRKSYIMPLFINADYINTISLSTNIFYESMDYKEEVKDYFNKFEKYCVKSIKEELIKDRLDYIIR